MLRDVRYALRMLLRSPGFSLVAIATLALGIGANTTIFSVINAVLLRPLPYPEADRIVTLSESLPDQPEISISWPNFLDWKTESTVFQSLAVGRRESFNLSGLENRGPERVSGFVVTAAFFKVVGLEPQIGRVFSEAEDTRWPLCLPAGSRPGAPPTAIRLSPFVMSNPDASPTFPESARASRAAIGASPIASAGMALGAKSISARRRNGHARRVRSPELRATRPN